MSTTLPDLPTQITIGAETFTIPPQTLAVERKIREATLAARRAELGVVRLQTEAQGLQQQMHLAAVRGEVDDADLQATADRIIALEEELNDAAGVYVEKRIAVIAARLDVDASRLVDLIDIRQLADIEEALVNPPDSRRSDDL